MAKGRRCTKEADQPQGLSAREALAELDRIDRAIAAYVETAPEAVEAMGGRAELRRISEPTCVGPVPRFTIEGWSALAAEHAARHAPYGELAGRRVERPEPRDEGCDPSSRGRGFVGRVGR